MPDPLSRLRSALAGRYAIERELGAGGMATVYLARDLRLDRVVALKVLRPELATAIGAERFLREIKTTAQLLHPHILPLVDSGQAGDALYYAMPFAEGESLRERLTRDAQLPVQDALRIACEVAEGLAYAHGRGVVHRDIKPENILLQAGHAVLADFGIARAVDEAASERLTGSGFALGTPAYMSPEQAEGRAAMDGRSDLYALGCVLYEMLSGEPPYNGPTPQAILAKKLSEPLPRITVVRETVPPGVEAALRRVLARVPADRFATAEEFAAVLAQPETVRPAAPAWWRRRAVRAAGAALVLAAGAVAAVLVFGGRGPRLDRTVVVVAPFENPISDTSLAQLGAVAGDWVAQVLEGTGAIKVVSTAAVLATHWSPGGDPRTLAARTGAGTVVTGRSSLQGDSVYLRADVLDGRTGALLSSVPPVAAGARQPLKAVTELARRVGGAAAAILDPERAGDVEQRRPPASYEAYQRWAEGSHWVAAGDWERAWSSFEQAYALDTTFLRALIGAATMHANANQFAVADSLLGLVERRRDRLTHLESVRLDALRANLAGDNQRLLVANREVARLVPPAQGMYNWGWAAIAANHPAEAIQAFTSRGYDAVTDWPYGSFFLAAAYHLLGRHEQELEVARAGRRVFPRSLVPVSAELRALAALGRDDDVFRLLDQARLMQPEGPNLSEYWGGAGPWQPYEAALELRAHGRLDASRRAIARALALVSEPVRRGLADSSSAAALLGRAMVLYAAERWADARAAYAALHRADATNPNYLGGLAVSEARLGHRRDAEALARRLAAMHPPYLSGRVPYWRARIAALLGDRDQAVALLRDAIARGIGCAVHTGTPDEDCHREMDFESLRGYPPFDDLLRPRG